jgi:peptidyl-prolyl cis-trans isomerase D
MALLGTLRDRMGTWVVVFVFVAIAAFILGLQREFKHHELG